MLVTLAVLISSAACGAASSPPATTDPTVSSTTKTSDVVAYTTDKFSSGESGGPLVQVTLNDGTRATFLLDTGTSACAITDAMVAKLGLTPQTIALPAAPLIMDGPKAQTVPLTIQLGRFRFPHFPCLVIKESRFRQVLGHPLDGILGINLLSHFAIILESQNHVLVLQTPGKLSASEVLAWGFRQASVLPLTRATNGSYWTPVGLTNGAQISQENLMIDTGAAVSILASPTAKTLGLTPIRNSVPIPFGNGLLVGDLARVPTVTLGTVSDSASAARSTLTLHDGEFLYSSQPEAFGSPHVLGMNILAACSVLLDFPGQVLYLQPSQIAK